MIGSIQSLSECIEPSGIGVQMCSALVGGMFSVFTIVIITTAILDCR